MLVEAENKTEREREREREKKKKGEIGTGQQRNMIVRKFN
jgi:hypothetical protein